MQPVAASPHWDQRFRQRFRQRFQQVAVPIMCKWMRCDTKAASGVLGHNDTASTSPRVFGDQAIHEPVLAPGWRDREKLDEGGG
ncbi:unnamed protein product [Ectocarpus sp. 12 AP-2014]